MDISKSFSEQKSQMAPKRSNVRNARKRNSIKIGVRARSVIDSRAESRMGGICTTASTKNVRGHEHILMIAAAASGDFSKLTYLVENKANVDSCDRSGRSALHLASSEGHIDIVKYLVDRGAKLNVKDRWDNEPIQEAMLRGHDEVVSILLSAGATLSRDCKSEMEMKLRHHVGMGSLPDVRHLVESGVPVNAVDYLGRTPLHIAAERGRSDIVEYLISKNADVNLADDLGETALSLAVSQGHREVQRLLRQAQATTSKSRSRQSVSFRKSSLCAGAAVFAASLRDFFVPSPALEGPDTKEPSGPSSLRKVRSLLDINKAPRSASLDPADAEVFRL